MSPLLLFAALAVSLAAVGPTQERSSAEGKAAAVHLQERTSRDLERPGATAAFAVDQSLVEASIVAGRVSLRGVRPGTTPVTIVTPHGTENVVVTVDPAPPRVVAGGGAAVAADRSSFQAGFDSRTGWLTTDLDAVSRAADRLLRLRVASVTGAAARGRAEEGTALPSFSLGVESKGRALVLGDDAARVSPLTLDGGALRGVHYSSRGLLVHAGWRSSTLYEDFFLPADREAAVGASYRVGRDGATLTPSLYFFPTDSAYGGTSGAFGSLLYTFGGAAGRVGGLAELGYGGGPAAAGELTYRGHAVEGRLDVRRQPDGVASLGLGRPHGTFAHGDGATRLGPRLTLATSFSVDHNESAALSHRSDAGSAELRFVPARRWRFRAGARLGSFDLSGSVPATRTLTLPLEAAWSGPSAGLAALYRYEQRSGSVGPRSGGRLSGHLGLPRLRLSGYVDVQPSAVAIDVVLGGEPGLARALAELGLSAQTPDDLARLLRENAALVDLGYFDPASVRFDARREQVGLDAAWTPSRGQRLGARVLLDRTTTGDVAQTTRLATLEYSRAFAGIELFGSATLYSRGAGRTGGTDPSFRVGFRRGFAGLPGLPRLGSRALVGTVFRDDEADGRPDGPAPGVGGVEVRLDDGRITRTDEAGRFRFENAGRAQRVEVSAPPGTYFTTPSEADVADGRASSFGLAFAPARLTGRVSDDAGEGLAGVRLAVRGEGRDEAATTDGAGRFVFALPAGRYELTLEPGSLPPGYAAGAGSVGAWSLRRGEPVEAALHVTALRSLGGRVVAADPTRVRVCLPEEDRCTAPGLDGRYVFRDVRSGPHTVVATSAVRSARRRLDVPREPGTVSAIDLDVR